MECKTGLDISDVRPREPYRYGDDVMITNADVEGVERAAQAILSSIDQMDKKEANQFITQWLIDTGALNEDGSEKEQIVTGDFWVVVYGDNRYAI